MKPHVKKIITSDPLSSPRICMVSCHTEGYREIAKTTVHSNKGEYAKRWGHDLFVLEGISPEFYDPKSHADGITWDRMNEVTRLANESSYDWIYVVGADTLITNMTIPLASLIDENFHFIIANDCNEWNADSFLLRCSDKGAAFADDVMRQYERLKYDCWVEQRAMIDVRDNHPGVCKTLPQRAMNSYDYELDVGRGGRNSCDFAGNNGQWQPGDFLIHWAGLGTDIRITQINRRLPQIVR